MEDRPFAFYSSESLKEGQIEVFFKKKKEDRLRGFVASFLRVLGNGLGWFFSDGWPGDRGCFFFSLRGCAFYYWSF